MAACHGHLEQLVVVSLGAVPEGGWDYLIVAAASARAPISLIREAWVPIRIGGIATVPSAKRICQTLRAREGQDPRRSGISIVSVIGPHLA